jgi:uncharacterized LabA/DUF88 family protein
MRTFVYVDGFNLYYGAVKGTPYKWLDLKALFTRVLDPACKILAIKYYTAIITARPDDPDAPTRQVTYFNALKAYIPEIYIKYGHFISKPVTMRLEKPTMFRKFASVIKSEEKGSDVNLALHLLNDAWRNQYDCAVLVSNDSDIAETLRLVRKHHKKRIILLVPGNPDIRPPAIQLKRYAHTTISIPMEAIAASQLPNPIPGTTIHKPVTW